MEKPVKTLELPESPDSDTWILSSCWDPKGTKIYTGRRNESIDEWDFGEGKLLRQIKLPNNSRGVTCVQAFKNGQHLLWWALPFLPIRSFSAFNSLFLHAPWL